MRFVADTLTSTRAETRRRRRAPERRFTPCDSFARRAPRRRRPQRRPLPRRSSRPRRPEADGQADKPKPRRRRGSRGGRGRGGKKKVEATAESGAKTDSKAEPKAEPKQRQASPEEAEGQARRRKPRRRRTQTDEALGAPKVKKEILVSVEVGGAAGRGARGRRRGRGLSRAARRTARSQGTSTRASSTTCLPGMEASFVDIGLEKNGFLYVDEIVVPELEGKQRTARRIQELIERGAGGARPGGQGPDGHEGRPADDRDLPPGTLPRLRSLRRRHRRLAPPGRRGARAAEGDLQGPRPSGRAD